MAALVAAQPDIGLASAVGRQDQQQAAGDFRGLAAAQVSAGLQPRPLVAAAALAAGIDHEGWQAFFGQGLHARHGSVFFTQQLDFVEGHPQVGVQALFGGGEVAPGVDLVAGDGLFVFALATQQHYAGSEHHNQQADQKHVQGFVPGAGRARITWARLMAVRYRRSRLQPRARGLHRTARRTRRPGA